MQLWVIIVGIFLFAIATCILYMIGMNRKIKEKERLSDMLLNNCAHRVVSYLKRHETITADGIGHLIKEVKAREFMSKNKAIIADGSLFQDRLIAYMLERKYIERIKKDNNLKKAGKVSYRLKSKE